MGRYDRYIGYFLSKAGVIWEVRIWQERDSDFDEPGELDFPSDSPLTFDWPDTGKEKPILGSSATLTIISPGDRTYVDLYTEKPGTIGMSVYRNQDLYWCGCLDPEQYEEPYERKNNYEVTLTFQDFGLLDRIPFSGKGLLSGDGIFSTAMEAVALEGLPVDDTWVSTCHDTQEHNTRIALEDFIYRADNFYDEDGEASTLYEVLEGILQPLSLRMVQRNGRIWLYDLNGLATAAVSQEVEWSGDSQTLGVDKVYNNIKLTFSPYASGKLLETSEVEFTDNADPDKVNLASQSAPSDGNYWSYFPDYGNTSLLDPTRSSFTIHIGDGKGLASVHNYTDGSYFKIVPQAGGSEAVGVMWGFYTGGHQALRTGLPQKVGRDWNWNGVEIYRTRRVYLGPATSANQARWMLRLKIEALLDMRYNPFTEPSEDNEEGNCNEANDYLNYVTQPVLVRLWDSEEGGNCLYTYDNSLVMAETGGLDYAVFMADTIGGWTSTPWDGILDHIPAYLEWYDETTETGRDRRGVTGIQEWQGNRQCIGTREGTLSGELSRIPDGQYIPYPPTGGWMDITLISGLKGLHTGPHGIGDETARMSQLRWMLFKAPQLEVVSRGMSHQLPSSDDVEHSAWVNANAKEELSIDTITGTLSEAIVSARGVIGDGIKGGDLGTLYRAGRALRPERLLIGTLYSQFATRHTKLSGEATLYGGDLCPFTERNQGSKLFIMTGETQNAIADTTEAVLVELSPDEYDMEIFES